MDNRTLRERIELGDIQLIADKSGVSRQIVSRVLRGANVKASNRDKVMESAITIFSEREQIAKS